MVRRYENCTTFQFNWNQVVQGFWQRYPNPNSGHVLSEDTIKREVKNGVLYTTRLLTKTNRIPKGAERFVNKNTVKIVEESIVDPKAKTLTTYTRNLGYTKIMSVVEKVVYKISDDNPNWTVAQRLAWIDSSVFGFSKAIQAIGIDRFKKNCNLMYNGFNYVLAHMFPHTAQYMNPTLAQMGFAHRHDEGIRSTLAEDFQQSFQGKAEKVKDAAKKATDLAKKKAGPLYAACQPQQS
ncbi:protein preli-like [Hylaeus volcanicus]|uniref:protein preli-like n=1 Tax=Hylaeus volcanicus TaxID=313075 RepID=UPI0023B778E0|nr:protein preli-like [Hylaeus volcanicus]